MRMIARQQVARLLPLAVLVLLAAVGLRAGVTWPRWNGPLTAYGVVIGIGLEVILAALLAITFRQERIARRREDERIIAASAARAASGGVTSLAAGRAAAGNGAAPDEDDRDVAASLRLLLRWLLGLAMIAVAIALLANLHLHLFKAGPPPRPLPRPRVSRTPQRVENLGGWSVHIPLEPILYALLVIALLAVLALSIWWARRLSQVVALPSALPGSAAEDSEGLREAVASGRAAMADLDDARVAIIACYTAMESSLAERGAERGAAGTPDELLRRAIGRQIIRGGGARRLTTLFYEARFSTHELGPGQRDAAAAALDEIAAELEGTGLEGTEPEGTGPDAADRQDAAASPGAPGAAS
jgi:hypothetical protein